MPINPLSQISPKARLALYVIYAISGAVLIYLQTKGLVGIDEYTLFVSIGSIFGLTAASNVSVAPPEPEKANDEEDYIPEHAAES